MVYQQNNAYPKRYVKNAIYALMI